MEINAELIHKRLNVRRGQIAYCSRNPGITVRRNRVQNLRDELSWIGICPYCNQKCDKPAIDHFIAIAVGGTDELDNLVLCCKSCNSSKHKKTFILWLAERPRNNAERYLFKFARVQ